MGILKYFKRCRFLKNIELGYCVRRDMLIMEFYAGKYRLERYESLRRELNFAKDVESFEKYDYEKENENMYMKVIDLLNKIANGQQIPLKFKYDGKIYYLNGGIYMCEEDNGIWFFEKYVIEMLVKKTAEIEILVEEPKQLPEKISKDIGYTGNLTDQENLEALFAMIINNQNQLIEYIKSKEGDK